jgi:MASE1
LSLKSNPLTGTVSRSAVLLGMFILAGLFGAGQVSFQTWTVYGIHHYPLAYLPVPFLLWSAFRFGPRCAATGTWLLATLVIYSLLNDAERVHDSCRLDWGGESVIVPAKQRADRTRSGFWRGRMSETYLARKGYGSRWAVESFFSGLERTLDPDLPQTKPTTGRSRLQSAGLHPPPLGIPMLSKMFSTEQFAFPEVLETGGMSHSQ